MPPMTPGEAECWLEEFRYAGYVPQLPALRAIQTIAEMDTETVTTEPHPRGSWNGDAQDPHYFDVAPGTRMRRHVTEWSKA